MIFFDDWRGRKRTEVKCRSQMIFWNFQEILIMFNQFPLNWWIGKEIIHLVRTYYFLENDYFFLFDTHTYVWVEGVRNISFLENFAYILNKWSQTEHASEKLRRYKRKEKREKGIVSRHDLKLVNIPPWRYNIKSMMPACYNYFLQNIKV